MTHVLTVVPNYYDRFRCIGGDCRHNCCIGWEIGIDDDALARYRAWDGVWGERIARAVSEEDGAHFVTDENGRCPFLNVHGLCDIQATFGEPYLCTICREHPRFHNELPDRVESGLGLCCEAAARLILGQKEPMTLLGGGETTDEIIAQRDAVLTILQDRSRSIDERIDEVLVACEAAMPPVSLADWAQAFLSLERLDAQWTSHLKRLRNDAVCTAIPPTAYEQLLVYFVYRHAANAVDRRSFATRVCFAVLGYRLIGALTAAEAETGKEFDTFCDLARAFSAEIEYSDENFDIVLELLGGVYHGSDIAG